MTFGYQADEREAFAIMETAAEAGVHFIDTADGLPLAGTRVTAPDPPVILGPRECYQGGDEVHRYGLSRWAPVHV